MALKRHQHLKQSAPKEEWEDRADCVTTTSAFPTFFLSLMMHTPWIWLNLLCISFSACRAQLDLGSCPKDKTTGRRDGHGVSYPTVEPPTGGFWLWILGEPILVRIWNGMSVRNRAFQRCWLLALLHLVQERELRVQGINKGEDFKTHLSILGTPGCCDNISIE